MSEGVRLGEAEVIRETDLAILVNVEGEEEAWIPKSVIHDDSEVYSMKSPTGELIVEEWWAKRNGFA